MPLLAAVALAFQAATLTVAGETTVGTFDSASINAALAAASPGDIVRLPGGEYEITGSIRPRSGVRLIGDGQAKTILRYTGHKPGAMIAINQCENLEIAHLTLDGQRNTNAIQGISGGNSHHVYIHHVTIRNLVKGQSYGPHGILFSGTNPTRAAGVHHSEISDCLIENIGTDAAFGGGIRMAWGSSNNRILRNVIRNTGRGGIFGDNGSTDLTIQGNRVSGSGGEGLGIEVWLDCNRAVIEDNVIDHWLSIGGSHFCAVRRNVISDKSGRFKAYGIEGIGSDCIYTDNLVDDGQAIGLSVSSTCAKDRVYWGYNTIKSCIQWGAQLQGEANGMARHYFYRCTFAGTSLDRGRPQYPSDAGCGLRAHFNVKDIVFEECRFCDNARYGLQLGPRVDRLDFLRSTITGNKGAGIVGPGEYHPGPAGPRDYSRLEWTDCRVEHNGSNKTPPVKPFASPLPTAAFDVPVTAPVGKPVRLASTSRAARGAIAALLWDFGDGPPSVEPTATHVYSQPGDYRVTLIVWDDAGRGARAEKRIRIQSNP